MEELLNAFKKAIERLGEALKEEKTTLNRDAAIQRFEFTVELAWKCVQKFLKEQMIICRSPKECLKEAFKFGLIDDDQRWLMAFDDRNLTTHTYREEIAEKIFVNLAGYLEIFQKLMDKLEYKK